MLWNSERQLYIKAKQSVCEMKRLAIVPVLFLLLLVCCQLCHGQRARRVKRIVGGSLAARPPPDDPVIFARAFSRDARVEGYRSV